MQPIPTVVSMRPGKSRVVDFGLDFHFVWLVLALQSAARTLAKLRVAVSGLGLLSVQQTAPAAKVGALAVSSRPLEFAMKKSKIFSSLQGNRSTSSRPVAAAVNSIHAKIAAPVASRGVLNISTLPPHTRTPH